MDYRAIAKTAALYKSAEYWKSELDYIAITDPYPLRKYAQMLNNPEFRGFLDDFERYVEYAAEHGDDPEFYKQKYTNSQGFAEKVFDPKRFISLVKQHFGLKGVNVKPPVRWSKEFFVDFLKHLDQYDIASKANPEVTWQTIFPCEDIKQKDAWLNDLVPEDMQLKGWSPDQLSPEDKAVWYELQKDDIWNSWCHKVNYKSDSNYPMAWLWYTYVNSGMYPLLLNMSRQQLNALFDEEFGDVYRYKLSIGARDNVSEALKAGTVTPIMSLVYKHPKYVEGDDGEAQYVVTPISLEHVKAEGEAMQNCLRHGTYDSALSRGDDTLYSIRDANNNPHVDVLMSTSSNSLIEARGKNNKDVPYEYRKAQDVAMGVNIQQIKRAFALYEMETLLNMQQAGTVTQADVDKFEADNPWILNPEPGTEDLPSDIDLAQYTQNTLKGVGGGWETALSAMDNGYGLDLIPIAIEHVLDDTYINALQDDDGDIGGIVDVVYSIIPSLFDALKMKPLGYQSEVLTDVFASIDDYYNSLNPDMGYAREDDWQRVCSLALRGVVDVMAQNAKTGELDTLGKTPPSIDDVLTKINYIVGDKDAEEYAYGIDTKPEEITDISNVTYAVIRDLASYIKRELHSGIRQGDYALLSVLPTIESQLKRFTDYVDEKLQDGYEDYSGIYHHGYNNPSYWQSTGYNSYDLTIDRIDAAYAEALNNIERNPYGVYMVLARFPSTLTEHINIDSAIKQLFELWVNTPNTLDYRKQADACYATLINILTRTTQGAQYPLHDWLLSRLGSSSINTGQLALPYDEHYNQYSLPESTRTSVTSEGSSYTDPLTGVDYVYTGDDWVRLGE